MMQAKRLGRAVVGLLVLLWAVPGGAQPCPTDCDPSEVDARGCCPSPPAAFVCPMPTTAPSPVSVPRDDRRSHVQQRARALLVTETQQLESLLAATGPAAPDRVMIVRRLAEDYVELENAAAKDKAQAEHDRDALQATDPAAARQRQLLVTQTAGVIRAAQQSAIQRYTTITTDFPTYPQLDEVRYYLGYEYEQSGDLTGARRTYFSLIQSHPNSRFIPAAYLSFAELFFEEAKGDPSKWAVAQQAYQKVIGYPPPNNRLYGYGWFKLAHTFWRMGDPLRAASAFQRARDWGATFSQDPGAASISTAATADSTSLHALCPKVPQL